MAAYFLFDNLEVLNADALESYKRRVGPVVERHGGRYVVLGGPVHAYEETAPMNFPVMIEFPDTAAARGWYDSEEYRELKDLRQAAVRASCLLLEGRG